MPELPEVETTKTSLLPLIGQTVSAVTVRESRMRWPVPTDLTALQGYQLAQLDRRAKYLLASFIAPDGQSARILLLHLGMSGSLTLTPPDTPLRKHDHVILRFDDIELRYHDPRRFGALLWLDDTSEKLLTKLAPEPLSPDFSSDYLREMLQNKRVAIKSAIMDNHIVVGVGNIYATEALFHVGIHPARPAQSLTPIEIKRLTTEIKRILAQAIAQGGSTLRDYVHGHGENGYFQQTLDVYGRVGEPCKRCQTPLENLKIGQRASVYCAICQPWPQ